MARAYDFDSAKRLAEKLGYPLFIKPARAGSSIGIGKAETPEQLTLAIESALRVSDGRIIVEKLIDSPTELECAYLGGQYDIYTAPGSVVSDGEPYSYDRKYSSSRGVSISKKADVSDEIKEKIKDYSKRLKVFSGLRDIGRFDYFLSDGNLYFNEVNSFPGMTESSLYPEMLALCGVSLSDFVKSLVSMLDSR